MARRRDMGDRDAGDGIEPVRREAVGYTLGKNRTISDVLADDGELLKSEGIDPAWPGFAAEGAKRRKHRPNS